MAIRIPIISEFDDRGLARATRQFKELETTGQKAQFAIQKAAVPAALALGGLAVAAGSAFKAFAEDSAAADKLALSLQNSTGATDAQIAANEEFISSTSKAAAVADDELRPALDNLVRGTKDLDKAQQLLGLALDISAGTGKDLDSVTQALSKAFNGNLTALKKLDPSLAALVRSGASTEEVFAQLGRTFGGQAAAQANTAAGQMRGLSIQMDELKESVGQAVAPLIGALLPAFSSIAEWISQNTPLVIGLGVAIGGFAAAIVVANAAMTAWKVIAAATAAINAVMATSFTALWVATGVGIILAVIAAVVALQAKFQFMDNVIAALKIAFNAFWSFVTMVWDSIYGKVKAVAEFIGSGIKLYIDIAVGYFKFWYEMVVGFIDLISTALDGIFTAITSVGDALVSAFKFAFNKIAEFWNNTVGKLKFSVPDWVPLIGGKTFAVPKIPLLADGGIVNGPTLAMIGEAGPEAVIPLDRLGSMGVTVNVSGSVIAERDLIETIRKGLVDAQRSGYGLVYTNA